MRLKISERIVALPVVIISNVYVENLHMYQRWLKVTHLFNFYNFVSA